MASWTAMSQSVREMRAGVVGAGLMGAEIAFVFAPAGIDVLGHPIGPFTLMDNMTSSLCLQVQALLQDSHGECFRPPALLKQRVAARYAGGRGKPGWLGTPDKISER